MAFVLLILFTASSWAWFIYVDNKPKSSVELVDRIFLSQDLSGMIASDATMPEEFLEDNPDYFSYDELANINQFTIIEYKDNDNVLLIQTTPGLPDRQLYIRNMEIIKYSDVENILLMTN